MKASRAYTETISIGPELMRIYYITRTIAAEIEIRLSSEKIHPQDVRRNHRDG